MITILLNNKKNIAIGVFIILLLLYFTSTLSVQKPITEVQKYNKCELFPRCNFNKNKIDSEERNQLIQKYPDIDLSDKTIITDITIINGTDIKLYDVYIQSIKSEGYVITLYSKPNFTGEKMTISPINNKISIECLEKLMRSAIITPYEDKSISLNGSNTIKI